MAHTRKIGASMSSALMSCTLMAAAMVASLAFAEEEKMFGGFLTDPVEVYDQNEEYLDDYEVGGIDLSKVKILEDNGDMVKLDFGGHHAPAWVFKTDVKAQSACRQAAVAKAPKAKTANTMGLGGDLCE